MSCQHYRDLMFDFFEDDFSLADHQEILQHLQNCNRCRKLYELTEAENRILRDTVDIPVLNDSFNQKVMAAISAAAVIEPFIPVKAAGFKWTSSFSKVAVAAVLLLACLYVPGILPELQKGDVTRQAIVNPNLTPPSSVAQTQKESANTQTAPKVNDSIEADGNDAANQYAYTGNISGGMERNSLDPAAPTSPQASAAAAPSVLNNGSSDSGSVSDQVNAPYSAASSKALASTVQTGSTEASRSLLYGVRAVNVKKKDILSLKNIPNRFVLTATQKVSAEQMQFYFEDATAGQSFSVNVSPAANTAAKKAAATTSADEGEVSSTGGATPLNESSRILEYEGHAYQIIVSGNMTYEDLNQITNAIDLGPLSE